MNYIWLNVSTSKNWNRPPLGIVRVEKMVADYMMNSPENKYRLCYWDGEFKEISYSQYADRMEDLNHKICEFQPNDILVTLGLDWDYSFIDELEKIKNISSLKIVGIVYDLIPILYPQYCVGKVASNFDHYLRRMLAYSDMVLTISENSKSDLIKYCEHNQLDCPLINVIRLGDNILSVDDADTFPDGNHILYVSTIERRKNHETIYKAYHYLASKGLGYILPKLIFVGMVGWGVEDLIKDIRTDPLVKDKIEIKSEISDDELYFLYKKSLFCVYPSIYEGWGLPIAEALSYGKFVLVSNGSSLPEVGGDFVDYIEAWDVITWADKIHYYIINKDVRNSKETYISKNYQPFGWNDAISKIMLSIKNCASTEVK